MTEHLLLVGVKVVVLLLGSSIAFLSFLAYRRTGVTLMMALSLAFLLVAVGTFVEGLLFESFGWDLPTVHVIESAFVLLGLGILAVVLRPRRSVRATGASLEGGPPSEDGG
ncbi:MAG: hypothetical protein R3291_03500 [Thermoplasmata archaeon]|nr:hypothetical protein [Thermoplasmata archaeon]